MGFLLENAVYLQLKVEGYQVYTGALRNGEIDFVAVKGDHILYLQIAVTVMDQQVYDKEFGAF